MSPVETPAVEFPSAEAKYVTYNLFPTKLVDALSDILAVEHPRRLVLLSGMAREDQLYLLETAAHSAAAQGVSTAVGSIRLDDFEPDRQTPAEFVSHLLQQEAGSGEAPTRLRQSFLGIAEGLQGKLDFDMAAGFSFSLSLGVKALGVLRQLLHAESARLPGPQLPPVEFLHLLLARLTEDAQLVVFVPAVESLPGTLLENLTHVYKHNPRVVLVFGCADARGCEVGTWSEEVTARFPLPPHDISSLRQMLDLRFPGNDFPHEFGDRLLRTSGGSPWVLAGVLLRLCQNDKIVLTSKGGWHLASPAGDAAASPEALFAFLPLVGSDPHRVDRLRASADPADPAVRELILRSALCGANVPIRLVAETVGAVRSRQVAVDDLLDALDASFGDEVAEPADAVFTSWDYRHPGFPCDVLVYSFRDGITRWAVGSLESPERRRYWAAELLGHLGQRLRPERRGVARLMLDLAREAGDEAVLAQWEHRLSWWVSLTQADELQALVERSLRERPGLFEPMWQIAVSTEGSLPPSLNLALVNALESNGIPLARRAVFHLTRAGLQDRLGSRDLALRDLHDALAACPTGEVGLRFSVYFQLCAVHTRLGDADAGVSNGRAALRLARRMSNGIPGHPEAACHAVLAQAFDSLGEFHQAKDHAETAVRQLDLLIRLNLQDTRFREPGHQSSEEFTLVKARSILASTLRALGELAKARALGERVLEDSVRMLGEEHPETLIARMNHAATLHVLGEWVEVRAVSERVLEGFTRIMGEEHPHTSRAVANLASTLRDLGELAKARELGERALESSTRILGEDHPDTLSDMANLSWTLRELGELAEARALGEHALEARTRILGEEHPDTLKNMEILASTLRELGEPEEARALAERGLEGSTRILGEEHPHTLRAMTSLAATLRALGEPAKARELAAHALEGSTRILGEEHPYTLVAMASLASTLRALGEEEEARVLEERASRIRRGE